MKLTVLFSAKPRRGWDEGAVAVEAAIVLSAFLTLLLGIIEFGTAFWQWNTMLLAVEQAGRYVMINNTTCNASCAQTQMQAVLTSAAVCTTPSAGQICVNATTGGGTPPTMTLTAVYNFDLLGLFGTFTLQSQGTVPLD